MITDVMLIYFHSADDVSFNVTLRIPLFKYCTNIIVLGGLRCDRRETCGKSVQWWVCGR